MAERLAGHELDPRPLLDAPAEVQDAFRRLERLVARQSLIWDARKRANSVGFRSPEHDGDGMFLHFERPGEVPGWSHAAGRWPGLDQLAPSRTARAIAVARLANGHTMRHVVRWVVAMDRPTDDDPGTLAPLVRLLTDHDDDTIASAARQVQGWLHGQWGTDPRTSSSIYTTARNAIWPWTDPGLAASADGCDITLDWLTSGGNTLYLSAPLGDEGRLGVVFSVLLQDLIGQAFVRANRGGTSTDRRLLVLLDEAANTPLPKLPQWAATVAGARHPARHRVAVEGPARPGVRQGRRQRPREPPHQAHLPQRPQRPRHDRLHQRDRR